MKSTQMEINEWYNTKLEQFGENDFSNHKNKRKIQIDKWFPKSREKKINL